MFLLIETNTIALNTEANILLDLEFEKAMVDHIYDLFVLVHQVFNEITTLKLINT